MKKLQLCSTKFSRFYAAVGKHGFHEIFTFLVLPVYIQQKTPVNNNLNNSELNRLTLLLLISGVCLLNSTPLIEE